jgi:hypothetical protein
MPLVAALNVASPASRFTCQKFSLMRSSAWYLDNEQITDLAHILIALHDCSGAKESAYLSLLEDLMGQIYHRSGNWFPEDVIDRMRDLAKR